MKCLRYILCLLIVTMASAFGVNMAFAVPMGTSEITNPQTENTHSTAVYDVGFAARAPPMAVSNVEITGGVTGMSGSTFALHGQEKVTALFGFGGDLNAPNRTVTEFVDGVTVVDRSTGRTLTGTVDLRDTLTNMAALPWSNFAPPFSRCGRAAKMHHRAP